MLHLIISLLSTKIFRIKISYWKTKNSRCACNIHSAYHSLCMNTLYNARAVFLNYESVINNTSVYTWRNIWTSVWRFFHIVKGIRFFRPTHEKRLQSLHAILIVCGTFAFRNLVFYSIFCIRFTEQMCSIETRWFTYIGGEPSSNSYYNR